MKKTPIAALCTSATVSLSAFAFFHNKKNRVELSSGTLSEGFTVTAHTGCEGTDDNTLESIRAGAAANADIVEIDLHFTPDGTPVLSHDKPAATSKNAGLPTLDSAFALLSELNVKMNVDVKSTANIPAVITLAEKHKVTDKIFFTGVEEKDVDAIKEGAPGISYFLNVGVNKKKNTDPDYLSSLVEKVKSCGAMGINMNLKGGSKELISAFRSEKLLISLWTANSKKQIYRCLYLEPDNITTRRPSMLRKIINELCNK